MFVIPGAKQWTLIVSKSTDMTGAYDEQKDLVRVPMESGELPSPEVDSASRSSTSRPGNAIFALIWTSSVTSPRFASNQEDRSIPGATGRRDTAQIIHARRTC